MSTTTSTRAVPAGKVFGLAHKVQTSWQNTPAIFTGYETTKADFDTLLDSAAAAESSYQQSKAAAVASKAAAKNTYKQALAAAKAAYLQAVQTTDTEVATNLVARNTALTVLSRAANGARYFAKSKALSDADETNDAAAREL